jgi:hypothetical protein
MGISKFHPITCHEVTEGKYKYSFTLSLTSALDRGGGQRHSPAALPSGKLRESLYRRLIGPRAFLDSADSLATHQLSNPEPSSPYPVEFYGYMKLNETSTQLFPSILKSVNYL